MGKGASRYVPKYFTNFNIENRAIKKINANEAVMSPRHPSTVEYFKKNERKLL
jgi:hypothetical protein